MRLCDNNEGKHFFGAFLWSALFLFLGVKMEIYRVALIGHRNLQNSDPFEKTLENLIRTLLLQKEYVEFYIGRNGDFDIFAASVIKRVQKAVGGENSSLILLLPYHAKDEEYYQSYYDEICFPIEETNHFKSAITKRNQWMIEQADIVFAYVERPLGGAAKALQYAEKRGIKIVNLAKQEKFEEE